MDASSPRLSKKRQALLGILVYGGVAIALVIGIATRSLLAAVFFLFGFAGLILAVGSVAMMVGMSRRARR